ncbi:hypothetical protein NFI95_01015 [Acetobacteraceae bacterium KSS8]|uniref:Calcineurin-like phosphoesterase domain-containing protein n=1 Tax=Endosaccharibacter trunci TaxID=2812733 RepID=A0ABT1W2D4_9PROT|nr:hypothetical protein [Acetobacteraceae bacterium KSS8]
MSLTRRRLAATAAALPLIAQAPRTRAPEPPADLTLILMGDLHSGYRWSSRLLRAVSDAVATARGPVRIVVNGDVFEGNNILARRTRGSIDFALLRRFAALAPTLVTIGNHDSDLFDPLEFVSAVNATGARVVSDIADPRRHGPYAARTDAIVLPGGQRVVFAAIGTPDLSIYPPAMRPFYDVPDPARYAARDVPALIGGAALPVLLVHAGFQADRAVLAALPPGPVLLHGAHDHLRFTQPLGNGLHLQSGAWSSAFQIATIRFESGTPRFVVRDVVLGQESPADPALQAMIDREAAAHLRPEDRAVIGQLDRALALEDAIRRVADRMRQDTGCDLALLSHTTFGDGLPAGDVTQFDRAGFLRFDGGVATGEIAQDRLPFLLARLNQFDGVTAYNRRTGDYLHPSDLTALPASRPVRVAVNAYAASSSAIRRALFGWDVPGFQPSAGGPKLSHLTEAAING